MSDPLDTAFHALRLEYLASMPERLQELRSDIAALQSGQPGMDTSIKVRLHRLAGSGGSYGFTQLSSIAREAEHRIARHPTVAAASDLTVIVERLAQAAEEAARRLGGVSG